MGHHGSRGRAPGFIAVFASKIRTGERAAARGAESPLPHGADLQTPRYGFRKTRG
jgi:hypothetical protein